MQWEKFAESGHKIRSRAECILERNTLGTHFLESGPPQLGHNWDANPREDAKIQFGTQSEPNGTFWDIFHGPSLALTQMQGFCIHFTPNLTLCNILLTLLLHVASYPRECEDGAIAVLQEEPNWHLHHVMHIIHLHKAQPAYHGSYQ